MKSWQEQTGYRGNVLDKAAWWAGFSVLCAIAVVAWVCNGFR